MIARIIEILSGLIVATISMLGYSGIVLLMAIESACIPLPSEIIMPFSGYLVSTGQMNLWAVAIAGAVGCVLGSLVAYAVGMFGGRPLIEKYGRYVLVSRKDLDMADRWFAKRGEIIVFVSRLLPAIRTFIAFPAGVARMNVKRFVIYTFAGSFPWCLGLAYVGQKLGEKWNKDDTLKIWFHRFDFLFGIAAVLVIGWWVWRHLGHLREERADA
ncbi:MAG TPA: alkaline phosphatase [Blastocatellia bacterium]|jgi:membrane protein DedA with SNARE-associated domain|nr:alkaline phosphatase [Blastocatellia bacterium]HAF24366.1 alkaline phosphatase [Blastocatellia bacterium]HCX29129.1 alkaline phosphatase [Blastocatellia bacterium]